MVNESVPYIAPMVMDMCISGSKPTNRTPIDCNDKMKRTKAMESTKKLPYNV